jgi:hypothetical protein
MANLSPAPWFQFVDANGLPYSGAKLFTYAAGTTTKLASYTDSALSIAHANPIILDSAGRTTIYLSAAAYKFVLAPASDSDPPVSAIRTQDNILPYLAYNASVGAGGTASLCQGRLSLTSGTPVTTADVSAATNAYWNPYQGYEIGLYDGAAWNARTFSPITISLAGLTAATPYDIFAYDNSGVVTIEAPTAWTNATTRATALTTQDGVYVKSGALTRRYLGTIYINASGGQTDDTAVKRYVWNYYHRVPRRLLRQETNNTWTYTTATIRQANAAAANQVEFVIGVAEDSVECRLQARVANSTANVNVQSLIGLDSTTASATDSFTGNGFSLVAGVVQFNHAMLRLVPAVGWHRFTWLEYSAATGTTTWYGAEHSGLEGRVWA